MTNSMVFFLNPGNHIEFLSLTLKAYMDPGFILPNVNPILIREIPTRAFPVRVFYVTEKV